MADVHKDHRAVSRSPGVHDISRTVDMAELRHPAEPSRFALALVALAAAVAIAVFVLVSLGQIAFVIYMFGAIVIAVLAIWAAVQVWRIRLLGDAVLVSAQTLPEVQEVLDTVRIRLNYTRRVEVFVVDKISRVLSADDAPITLTTFFGVHVIVAEGGALGDLTSEVERHRLTFTLATYVGALKARYTQWWSPLFTAFQMTGLTVFVWPFVYPYYRATVYSGDRIAYVCCGDLDVSLQAVYRALVGKETAPHLRPEGLTGQALTVRRRRLLRFAQLLRSTPHATNRYLELLAFVSQYSPDEYETHRHSLGMSAPEAEPVLAALNQRRVSPNAPVVGIALATMILLAGLLAGLTAKDSPVAQALYDAYTATSGGETDIPGDGPEPPAPSTETSTADPVGEDTNPPVGNIQLHWVIEDVPYSASLTVDGVTGVADVTYVDPWTGAEVSVREDLYFGADDSHYYYAGENARDPHTDLPVNYYPDIFWLELGSDGWLFTHVCDTSGACWPFT